MNWDYKYQSIVRSLWGIWSVIISTCTLYVFIAYLTWLLIKECVKGRNKRKSTRHLQLERFQGPRAYPIIGNLWDFALSDFYEWGVTNCKVWSDPVRLWRLDQPLVLVRSYEVFAQLMPPVNMTKMKDIFLSSTYFDNPSGIGAPSTVPSSLEVHEDILHDEGIKLLKKLDACSKYSEYFEITQPVMMCLFSMILRRNFGDGFVASRTDSDLRNHMEAFITITNNASKHIFNPFSWERNDRIYYHCTREGKETRRAIDLLHEVTREAVLKRCNYPRIIANNHDPENDQFCYLDALLNFADDGAITGEEAMRLLTDAMFGTFDVAGLTVTWTLLLLSLHPHYQQQVYFELAEILGSSGSSHIITPSEVERMKCLEICLKEAVRLFPPSPILFKKTVANMKLNDERIIPEGVDVLIFASLINRDPNHFPDPEVFNPKSERHLEDNAAFILTSPESLKCLGTTKAVLAYLLKRYFWETDVLSMNHAKSVYKGLLYPVDIRFKIRKRIVE